ncbi:MAG: TonB-dependent receptor plug domain-containing protein [Rhodospirillaceae bacterium]
MTARTFYRTGTAVVALLAAQSMTANEARSQTAEGVEEIVVTGTRIVRDGYQAPTPVSVLSADELNNMAQTNIADAVNRLPQLTGSSRPQNESADDINTGINNLNLRGLHPDRTLVLMDGRRLVGSTIQGSITMAARSTSTYCPMLSSAASTSSRAGLRRYMGRTRLRAS